MTPWNYTVYFVINQMAWSVKILFNSRLSDCVNSIQLSSSWYYKDKISSDREKDFDRQIICDAYFINTQIFHEILQISIKYYTARWTNIIRKFWKTSRICKICRILSGISRSMYFYREISSKYWLPASFILSLLSLKIRVLLAFFNKVKSWNIFIMIFIICKIFWLIVKTRIRTAD